MEFFSNFVTRLYSFFNTAGNNYQRRPDDFLLRTVRDVQDGARSPYKEWRSLSPKEEMEPTNDQGAARGSRGRVDEHPAHPVTSVVGHAEEFFNIFNGKNIYFLFLATQRSTMYKSSVTCYYDVKHSIYEVDKEQFCHCFHDCSPLILYKIQLIF